MNLYLENIIIITYDITYDIPGYFLEHDLKHNKACKFFKMSICMVPIECEHGYDVCPQCDKCYCEEEMK